MALEKITDVFFDLDHTLWDFDKNSSLAFERVFRKFNIEIPIADFIREYEPINLHYWKKYREDLISKEELRRGRLIEAFLMFDVHWPITVIDGFAKSYIEELPLDNHLFEGTKEVLDYLYPKYKLHIITNGFSEVQQHKLANSGIQSYFHTVTTSEEAGAKKPNPVIFELALTKALADPESSVMIGDNMEADIFGAQKVGMKTLFFNCRNEKSWSGCISIKKLFEIKRHL